METEKIKSKDVAMIVTSVGGILLAGFLAYALYRLSTNHVEHNTAAQVQTAEVLGNLSGAIQANTKVLESIDRRIK